MTKKTAKSKKVSFMFVKQIQPLGLIRYGSTIMLVPGTGTGGGVLYKKTVLQNLIKIAGRHLRWTLFFNKVAGLKPLIY